MKLASGVAPVAQMLALGLRVGLGTDGAASNNDLDMIGEMATVAKLHKVHSLDPTQLPARTVLRLATMGGARALRVEDRIGSLEPGKQADLIIVAAREPNALPAYHPDSQFVSATRAEAVQTVVVDGSVLMDRRRLRTLDTEAIRRHCLRHARRIGSEAGRILAFCSTDVAPVPLDLIRRSAVKREADRLARRLSFAGETAENPRRIPAPGRRHQRSCGPGARRFRRARPRGNAPERA